MAVDRVRMSDVEKAHDFCFSYAAEVLPEIKRLSGKGMTKIIHAEEVLPRIKQRVFEHRETDDQMTPFERGKAWTFEFLSQYQPRTARQLLGGSEFRLVAIYMGPSFSGTGDAYNTALVQEVNGQVVEIHRQFWGSNPDDPDYAENIERENAILLKRWGFPMRADQRELSLPEPLRMAYYHRIDGLSIANSRVFGIYGWLLPLASSHQWRGIDDYLAGLRLKKKFLPLVEEMIPGIKPADNVNKDMAYDFRMFLSSWGSFTGKKRSEGDHLFVKNHIQDGVVYYIRDADVANMMILAEPAEAVDRYCEHVLLRKEGRFDFRPWAVPFESPSV